MFFVEECKKSTQNNETRKRDKYMKIKKITWASIITEIMKKNGGKIPLKEIYSEVEKNCPKELSLNFEATIRRVIEINSSDSMSFYGKNDLFYSVFLSFYSAGNRFIPIATISLKRRMIAR